MTRRKKPNTPSRALSSTIGSTVTPPVASPVPFWTIPELLEIRTGLNYWTPTGQLIQYVPAGVSCPQAKHLTYRTQADFRRLIDWPETRRQRAMQALAWDQTLRTWTGVPRGWTLSQPTRGPRQRSEAMVTSDDACAYKLTIERKALTITVQHRPTPPADPANVTQAVLGAPFRCWHCGRTHRGQELTTWEPCAHAIMTMIVPNIIFPADTPQAPILAFVVWSQEHEYRGRLDYARGQQTLPPARLRALQQIMATLNQCNVSLTMPFCGPAMLAAPDPAQAYACLVQEDQTQWDDIIERLTRIRAHSARQFNRLLPSPHPLAVPALRLRSSFRRFPRQQIKSPQHLFEWGMTPDTQTEIARACGLLGPSCSIEILHRRHTQDTTILLQMVFPEQVIPQIPHPSSPAVLQQHYANTLPLAVAWLEQTFGTRLSDPTIDLECIQHAGWSATAIGLDPTFWQSVGYDGNDRCISLMSQPCTLLPTDKRGAHS